MARKPKAKDADLSSDEERKASSAIETEEQILGLNS